MSLGFLTESALLPSKSKKINVDSKSMIDLKAVVYEKQQELSASSSSGAKTLRSKRRREAKGTQVRNRGIEERVEKDRQQLPDDYKEKKRKVHSALLKKAAIYDQLAKGQNEQELGVDPDNVMVDFDRKAAGTSQSSSRISTEAKPSDLAEIEDEFGRVRTVKKSSTEYREYMQQFKEPDNIVEPEATESATSSHVTSQWERTLKTNEKTFLAQVHQETKQARLNLKEKKQKKLLKLERLRKLQAKAQANVTETPNIEDKLNSFLSNVSASVQDPKEGI